MSIELSPEDLKTAEALLAQGRFASIEDAVGAGLRTLLAGDAGLRWTPELQASVDAGIVAVRNENFASDAEVDTLFAQYSSTSV